MTVSTLPATPPDVHAEGRAWDAWASVAWVIVAEGTRSAVDFAIDHSPLATLAQHAYGWRVIVISLSWVTPLAVLALAVRLRSSSWAAYVAWTRPRLAWIAIGLTTGLALQLVGHGLPYVLTGSVSDGLPIEDLRAHVAAGASPWRYVLIYWPAAIYAPLVEETTYRGFLWRGLAASRLGGAGALWLTSLCFALVHYRYFIQEGTFIPGAFVGPLVTGLALGWVRRRSRSTIASMLAHSATNLALNVGIMLAVVLAWP